MEIKNISIIAETKWISLKQATYLNREGKESKWEYISRQKEQKVVTIICKSIKFSHLKKSKEKELPKFLFICQPRVPFNKVVIGFPAGLVEEEETPENAALRELKEETGYTGKIIKIYPEIAKSAGFTNETTRIVECSLKTQDKVPQELDEGEDIRVFWKDPKEFLEMVKTLDPDKYIVEMDAFSFIKGYMSSLNQ